MVCPVAAWMSEVVEKRVAFAASAHDPKRARRNRSA
jgi:hypothetical protein